MQIHAVDSELIEQLGLLRVGLIKRGGGDVEFAAEQLVAHAFGAIHDAGFLAEDGVAGASVDVLGDGDDARIECGDSLKELLRMRQVALSGHERDHDLVGTPTAADDGIAKQTKMLVLIKGGNMQPLSFACDAVENLTGARCLDGAFGYGNDLVRAALKETATDSALLTGSKGSGGLMAKTARRRIFARVAQGDTHATNRIYSNALTLTKRSKKLLHSSLLSCQLLFIRTIERRASATSSHDGTGRLGIHSLTRRRNRIFMRTLGASLRRFVSASTRVRTLGLSPALGRFAFCSFRRLGFRRRFLLLRPLNRLHQSTTSPTLRTRFCHQ